MGRPLEGWAALVTGAGQGIGEGVARALAHDGARVAVCGRRADPIERVASDLRERGIDALAVTCDVGDRAQVDALVAATVERFGRLDIVVNNAQAFAFRTVLETTPDDLELAHRSGPLGTVHVMQAAHPHLRDAGGGCIVNFGTTSALTGEPRFASYAMAKEAIRALTRVAASEWGPDGIRVNCICPTAASPSFTAWAEANPERAAAMASDRPLGRMGDPEADIGRAVASLVSDDWRYLTGATLMLNGGRFYL